MPSLNVILLAVMFKTLEARMVPFVTDALNLTQVSTVNASASVKDGPLPLVYTGTLTQLLPFSVSTFPVSLSKALGNKVLRPPLLVKPSLLVLTALSVTCQVTWPTPEAPATVLNCRPCSWIWVRLSPSLISLLSYHKVM